MSSYNQNKQKHPTKANYNFITQIFFFNLPETAGHCFGQVSISHSVGAL